MRVGLASPVGEQGHRLRRADVSRVIRFGHRQWRYPVTVTSRYSSCSMATLST